MWLALRPFQQGEGSVSSMYAFSERLCQAITIKMLAVAHQMDVRRSLANKIASLVCIVRAGVCVAYHGFSYATG